MRVLLPPSEAKNPGGRGRPLAGQRPHPLLGEARARLLAAHPAPGPTMPALRRYAGVVYAGLAFDTMTADEQRFAGRELLIFSGLLGVVRGAEVVPDYRLKPDAGYWRPVLAEAMPALLGRGLVVDLRSTDFTAMWRPPAGVVKVRILSRRPAGGWGVISYNSKFAKGRLTAALVRRRAAGVPVETIEHVAETWDGKSVQVAPDKLELYTD